MKKAIEFFKTVFDEWNKDKVTRLAASLSYYTVFSIAPLLVIVITVAGLFLGADVAEQEIVEQMRSLVGPQGAALIETVMTNLRDFGPNWVSTLIAIGAILFGATGVVAELKDALNTIWNVAPNPGSGLFRTFFQRLISLGMVLGLGFLLLVSLIASAILSALANSVSNFVADWINIAWILDVAISFLGVTLIFALLFKYLPAVQVTWRDVWIGALITALLFTIGKYAISLYLGNSDIASAFGAADSLVILLIWVYYSAQILFLGAEITQVYANTYGSGIRPEPDAVLLSDAAKVEQGKRAPSDPSKPPSHPGELQNQREPQARPASASSRLREIPQYAEPQGDPFNPIRLVLSAIGVYLFGWLENLLERTRPKSF